VTGSNSLLPPVDKGWAELDALVDSLGPIGLTKVGSDGWAVKDHLVHIAAWEHSLLALLDRRDRRAAMGVSKTAEDTDAINAEVWSLHQSKTPEQALAYFHETHALLMAFLSRLTDADLQRPYNDYQPDDKRDPSENRPVGDWVAGNTYEHYAEHIGWINRLVP
jgi:uncharacterized damage-inducible protein DinB